MVGEITEAKEKWDTVTLKALFNLWMAASQACFEVELWRIRLSNAVLAEVRIHTLDVVNHARRAHFLRNDIDLCPRAVFHRSNSSIHACCAQLSPTEIYVYF